MTLSEVKELMAAGFTAAEIRAFDTPTPPTPPTPPAPETPPTPPAPETPPTPPAPETPPTPPAPTDQAAVIKGLTDQVSALASVVKALQDANARTVTGPAPEKKSTEQAIRSFFGKPAER